MQEKIAEREIPPFGFISGLATTSSFLVPAIGLGIMGILGSDVKVATPLFIIFAIGVKFTGDWLFWTRMFSKEMDSGENLANWRSLAKNLLLTRPEAIK